MRHALLLSLSTVALLACGQSTEGPVPSSTEQPAPSAIPAEGAMEQTESDRLNAWFDEKYEEQLQFSPMTLTSLGRKEMYGQLDDFSEAAEDEQLAWRRAVTAEMEEMFDADALDAETRLSYDLWKDQTEMAEAGAAFRRQQYIFNQMGGIHSYLPTFMINFHRVDTEQDMVDYISRLNEFDRAFSQLVEVAEANAAAGVHPPRFAYEIVMDEINKLLAGAPFDEGEDTAILADAKGKIAALVENGEIDEARAEALEADVVAALEGSFKPGYERVLTFLESSLDDTPQTGTGVGALPDGEAYYAYQLKANTTTDLTADEVHEIGLSEVERLRGEMQAIMDEVEFEGSLQDFFAHVSEAEWNYYPDTDEGRQAYIDDATAAIDNIKAQLPDYFGILPKADLVVKRVEPFREQDGAAQHYYPGTPDGSRPGIYYAHLSDMTAMPKNQLEVIAYHEGLPGHHMQISIAQELEDVPEFRTQAFSTAYIEGWALYTELFSAEIPGTYEDPYSRFGQQTAEMWRAIRLVVDTGLHAKGWTEQEAIDYFAANSPEPEESIRSEVRRYLVLPGQATSYKIGMLKIQELRAMAEAELGDAFDIRGFHDAVIGGGAMPLPLLERRVMAWVEGVKAG